MTDSDRQFHEESWAFASQIYAKPGVADACLRLQEEAGVDVMILLIAAFAAIRREVLLTPDDIQELDALCRPWREQVVQPLRALRTALKSGPSPAPGAATERLRSQIKTSELMSERLQNDLLAEWLGQKTAVAGVITREDIRSALCNVVALALRQRQGGQTGDISSAIYDIVAAAKDMSA
jgi:uncharacterized protein (TIGR02444 family)